MSTSLPEGFACDECKCELVAEFYVIAGVSGEYTGFCQRCYEMIEDDRLYTRIDASNRTCDVCFQYIKSGTCKHLGKHYGGITICSKCETRDDFDIRKMVITPGDAVFTSRGCTYRYSGHDNLDIPEELRDRIRDIDLSDIDGLVRPPSYDCNMGKWQFIGEDYDEVPHFEAWCTWAIRCESGHHEIASVVLDDHFRMAMNIVFPDVKSFLYAEEDWRENFVDEDAREKLDREVEQTFDDRGSCDEDLIAVSTDSFAVYYRLKKKLCMSYG